MQVISTDKTVRSNTVIDIKEFNNQSLATQAKQGEHLVSTIPDFKKAFDLLAVNIVDLSTENDAFKNKIGSYDGKWLEESKAKLLKQIDDEKRANLIMSRMKKQMENIKIMAYVSNNKLWETGFDGIVSKRDKLQDMNINQLKLKVLDTYKKDEKITTTFEPTDDSDVINKSYLDEKLKKTDGHISYIGKDFNEFKSQYNKQSVEDILFQRAVETTNPILYDKGLIDIFQTADKVLEDFLFTTRRRADLSEQVNDDVQ